MSLQVVKSSIKKLTVIAFLIFLWVILIFFHLYLKKDGFFTLRYAHTDIDSTSNYNITLTKGERFKGSFMAKENNLGILAFPFKTVGSPSEDTIIFRIKEQGKNWFYEQKYNTNLLGNYEFYPFGFPKENSSKGKRYQFEIESMHGTPENGVSITKRNIVMLSKYEQDKSVITKSWKSLFIFMEKKFLLALSDPDNFFASIIYLFPLIFYIFWELYFKRLLETYYKTHFVALSKGRLKNGKKITDVELFYLFFSFNIKNVLNTNFLLFYVIIGGVFIDIFFIQDTYDLVIILLAILWTYIIYLYRIDYRFTFLMALVSIILCPLFLSLNLEKNAEKLSLWAYIFLWIGTIELLLDTDFSKKIQIQIAKLYKKK